MQSLLDVYYYYDNDNDILLNPIQSICSIFKPKATDCNFRPFLGSDALILFKIFRF